jgi:membrane protein implicated in regulation of membrane protease activity
MSIWNWEFWAIIAIVMLIVEIFTISFFFAAFFVGGLFASLGAAINLSAEWQLFLFTVGTILSYFFLKPLYLRYLNRGMPDIKTNADAVIGRTAKVVVAIPGGDEPGRVALDGDEWQALSNTGAPIALGHKVEIVSRDSLILTVKPHTS